MNRSSIAILMLSCALALSLGFIAFRFEEIGLDIIGYDEVRLPPPETVTLPFKRVYDLKGFAIEISPIAGEPNEILAKCRAYSSTTWEKREWIQHGPGRIVFNLQGGHSKYIVSIDEFSAHDQDVKSVRVSVRHFYR